MVYTTLSLPVRHYTSPYLDSPSPERSRGQGEIRALGQGLRTVVEEVLCRTGILFKESEVSRVTPKKMTVKPSRRFVSTSSTPLFRPRLFPRSSLSVSGPEFVFLKGTVLLSVSDLPIRFGSTTTTLGHSTVGSWLGEKLCSCLDVSLEP